MPQLSYPHPVPVFAVCSWCRCDLRPLDHATEHYSYGIYEQCQHQYFAHLYEADTLEDEVAEVLQERAVGE